MKKSRIIVPALAMIAFSTAASIAGSVAWFTASRQASVAAGTYAVVKTSADLECAIASGVGTTATTSGDTRTIDLGNNKLTDGSFNHNTGTIFQPNDAGDGLATTDGEVTLAGKTVEQLEEKLERADLGTNSKVYTAVTWDITFTVSFGATSGDYGLYLDTTDGHSKFEIPVEQGQTPPTPTTAKGFRIAIVPKPGAAVPANSETDAKVFADLRESAKAKYIVDNETTFKTGAAYASGELMDSAYNATLPTESTERATALARADYLGTFGFQASTRVSLAYTVVCWFEGTDEEIRNRDLAADYQSVKATLHFEAVKLKAAAQQP